MMYTPVQDMRLFLRLQVAGEKGLQLLYASRMEVDGTGRLILYDSRNRISASFAPGQATVLRIWVPGVLAQAEYRSAVA